MSTRGVIPRSAGWKTRSSIPAAAGIGLRFQHHQAVLDTRPEVAWLEVHIENYMGGGTPLAYLDAIRRDYPISVHGIGLSLGSAEGVDGAHLGASIWQQQAERVLMNHMFRHASLPPGNRLNVERVDDEAVLLARDFDRT